jgi:hypothetical protein
MRRATSLWSITTQRGSSRRLRRALAAIVLTAGLAGATAGCGGPDEPKPTTGRFGDPSVTAPQLVQARYADEFAAWKAKLSGRATGPQPEFQWTTAKVGDIDWVVTGTIKGSDGNTRTGQWQVLLPLDREPTGAEFLHVDDADRIRPSDQAARQLSTCPPRSPCRTSEDEDSAAAGTSMPRVTRAPGPGGLQVTPLIYRSPAGKADSYTVIFRTRGSFARVSELGATLAGSVEIEDSTANDSSSYGGTVSAGSPSGLCHVWLVNSRTELAGIPTGEPVGYVFRLVSTARQTGPTTLRTYPTKAQFRRDLQRIGCAPPPAGAVTALSDFGN